MFGKQIVRWIVSVILRYGVDESLFMRSARIGSRNVGVFGYRSKFFENTCGVHFNVEPLSGLRGHFYVNAQDRARLQVWADHPRWLRSRK